MVRIWLWLRFSHFYWKESFSFVRGLWLLDLNNRKTFLWKFFWICFASDVLKWWLASLQLPSIVEILVRSIFFAIIVLSTGGRFGWSVFVGGPQLARFSSSWIRGFSLVSLRSMITPFYCPVAFSFFILYIQIWYGWRLLMQGRGRIGGLELAYAIEITRIFQNWSGQLRSSLLKTSTSFSR